MVNIALHTLTIATTGHNHTTVSASAAVDEVLDFCGVTNCKLLMIQKLSGSIIFKITTADGAAQIIPVGRLLLWENESKPITAITYTGTGEFEVFISEW